jgi:hypothetical protein
LRSKPRLGTVVADVVPGGRRNFEEVPMHCLRSICAALLLAFAGLSLVAATPATADAYHYRWHGAYNYPYYWYNGYTNPYSAYSPYSNWNGRYGGYYNNYRYYNWSRNYPWGWYY